MPCAIAHKILLCFRQYIEQYNNNNAIYLYFEELWGNSYYSNQFKNSKIYSRIDRGHVKSFYNNTQLLIDIIKSNYRINNHLRDFIELLKIIPLLYRFWTKVIIESREQYLNEIKEYECNMSKFYEYGIDTIFTDMVHGNSETFYCHCTKYYVLRLVHIILDELNYGVGI